MGYFLAFFCLAVIVFWASMVIFRVYPWNEKLLVTFIALIVASTTVGIGMFSETSDTEILNGKVTSKEKERVSCSHSYDCNCRNVTTCTGMGKDRSCSTSRVCDTCYEHRYDYDWIVHSTIGNFEIDRVDRQGIHTPPRWSVVETNDPVSKRHTFLNYIKAARTNVINRQNTKITYPIPEYPDRIYDYYKVDRAMNVGADIKNLAAWNKEVSELTKELGPSKQLNLIVVFTKYEESYADQLNAAWVGGKKNDVIVVIGTNDGKIADWVRVLSWSKREDFKIDIRERIVGQNLNPKDIIDQIGVILNKQFERREMEEFKYLQYDIDPPFGFVVAALLLFFIPWVVYILVKKGVLK